jgi:hypothetical protein
MISDSLSKVDLQKVIDYLIIKHHEK